MVRRPIEIMSNPRHNLGRTVCRPLNGMGLKGKVAPPRIKPRASGLSRQCSATELRRPDGNHPPSKPLLAYFKRLLRIRFFKGLRTVRPRLCLGLDTISIGLRTTEESRPSDSSTAVITLRFLTISTNAHS